MSDTDFLGTIVDATKVPEAEAARVINATLEVLHRRVIVDDKGWTGAAMDLRFDVGARAAFHFLGLLAAVHRYAGNGDDALAVNETALRLVSDEVEAGNRRVAHWLDQRSDFRKKQDEGGRAQ
ncbi:hypothetical protein [Falsiroseomonas oryziterrae]|uniref:hypothetical protein n=1 Tax=Falsiroseomonas oryziterrae TaxID=2911368 RepID=UPI001F1B733B|nr:hypothetical protein [Roseomonas sp. NPKOSM-4]